MTNVPYEVLWLDPGRTTGYAELCPGPRVITGEKRGIESVGLFIDGFCQGGRAIGWEDYLGSGGSPRYAFEVIGVATYLALRSRCRILDPAPAASRVVCSDEALKRLGWWKPGHEHANQAAKHLVAWLLRNHLMMEVLEPVFTSLLE